MPISDEQSWAKCVENNDDDYGKACVDVAREVMKVLDERPGSFDCHAIICGADKTVEAGGLTGFMAGCVAQMVSKCHSRGEEFRRQWNIDQQIHDEGEKVNEGHGVLNPALLTVEADTSSG